MCRKTYLWQHPCTGVLVIALLQRVSRAEVQVEHEVIGAIEAGLLVLLGVERADNEDRADRLLDRVLSYRVFADENGKMNRSVVEIGGGVLIVPQFTLAADTGKGTRPGFSPAAPPEEGRRLFEYFVSRAGEKYRRVHMGRFGADMKVTLTNDGPVTFWLQTKPEATREEAP
jgi:D-aminoacyl-tRNA deacylase